MDDWDDNAQVGGAIGIPEGGRKFSSGRGFKAAEDDGWGNEDISHSTSKNGYDDSGWNDAPEDYSYNNNREPRGRGRGRGGYRGRGGSRATYEDNNYGNSNYEESESFRGRGRGRGASRGGTRNSNPEPEEKKREIYIPTERTEDEVMADTVVEGINFMKLNETEVHVTGNDAPNPIRSFAESGLRSLILDNVQKSGYKSPTPIQKYAIPIIMSGRDLMGCAQTGSGKTAAFLLPIIHKLVEEQTPYVVSEGCCQPQVIIISPTRELAIQIYEQGRKFAQGSIVRTVVAYGGTAVNHQKDRLLSGCHILVATPGRLNDFVKRRVVSYESIRFVVLDEADRMLDMGFLPAVEEMLGDASMRATGERQTLMFSATFPEEIQHLASKFLHNYLFITVGIVGSASSDVEQVFYQVSKYDKRDKLLSILRESGGKERTVVFVETKRNADFLATFLSENDIPTTSIHGDRYQREREQALWDFKKGIRNILVATGVAARGLDIKGVQHVINYDLPKNIDEYVHRIGRTGRVGNRGKATSFYNDEMDRLLAPNLARILAQAGQPVPDWLSGGGAYGGGDNEFGGRDIRGDDFGKAQDLYAQPTAEDEEW